MNYVPRFLAVAQIIKSPHAYGVSLPPIANRPHFREINVGAVNLNDVANITVSAVPNCIRLTLDIVGIGLTPKVQCVF